jgi:acyl-homoserine-lactone acylase
VVHPALLAPINRQGMPLPVNEAQPGYFWDDSLAPEGPVSVLVSVRDRRVFVIRNGVRVPVHGGSGIDGTTNVVGYTGLAPTVQDPALLDEKRERLVAGSSLYRLDGETGTPIVFGTSFLMALEFTDDGPDARAFLVYGNTEDPTHADFTAATERFSRKEWRPIEFREEAIEEATTATVTVRG